jgi:hypothetical protein|tara:strand:+ start:767 stop:1129 length:363 start_codon:yes stop_codon:yes gene_type:complete
MLSLFIVEADEWFGDDEPPLRIILQVDTIQELLCLVQQTTMMTIKSAYHISKTNLDEKKNLKMRKVSSIYSGIDSRYKHTLYFYSEEGNDRHAFYIDNIDNFNSRDISHTRSLYVFPPSE